MISALVRLYLPPGILYSTYEGRPLHEWARSGDTTNTTVILPYLKATASSVDPNHQNLRRAINLRSTVRPGYDLPYGLAKERPLCRPDPTTLPRYIATGVCPRTRQRLF